MTLGEHHQRGLYEVVLQDVDERYAPPEQPVLRIAMIGDKTVLEIGRVTEESLTTSTFETLQLITVDTHSLLQAVEAAALAQGWRQG